LQFLSEQRGRVHFVRLTAPMAGHRHARHASRAFLCAERQGKGDRMAEALFSSSSLVPAACEQIATSLGLSMEPFRACILDTAIDRQLDADLAWLEYASPRGLPWSGFRTRSSSV
jgi:hypothetical protein